MLMLGPLPRDIYETLNCCAAPMAGHIRTHLRRLDVVKCIRGAEVAMELVPSPAFYDARLERASAVSPLHPSSRSAADTDSHSFLEDEVTRVLSLFEGRLARDLSDALAQPHSARLCEARLDAGRPARVSELVNGEIRTRCVTSAPVDIEDIQRILQRPELRLVDAESNRMIIEGTLHRVTTVMHDDVCHALTIRLGRAVPHAAALIQDVVLNQANGSILVLGAPGSGKTTVMRAMVCLAAGTLCTGCHPHNHVVVVDTSRELSGESPEAHAAFVGFARCMPVPRHQRAAALEDALTNQFPTIIAMDEVGVDDVSELKRATMAGVRVFATAHAASLRDALQSPVLAPLFGGVHTVTRGDAAAGATGSRKTMLERAAMPSFDSVVKIVHDGFLLWQGRDHLTAAIDACLSEEDGILGGYVLPQHRMWPSKSSWTEEEDASTVTHMLLGIGTPTAM